MISTKKLVYKAVEAIGTIKGILDKSVIEVEATSVSNASFPLTISDSRITKQHICIGYYCSNRPYLQRPLTVTAAEGSITVSTSSASDTINGTISTFKFYLALKANGDGTPEVTTLPMPCIRTDPTWYTKTVSSLAANTYLGQDIELGARGQKAPMLIGYDISGTNTSQVHVMGAYTYWDSGTSKWYAYVKMRSGASALSNFDVKAYITWI